jgi:hypothetical protein
MSKGPEKIHEYRHRNGEDSIGVRVGSETDLAYAGEPDWELVSEVEPAPEPQPEAPEAPEEEVSEDTGAVDPDEYSRDELNKLAAELGIDKPESYGSKAEVAEAINAA